MASKTKIYQKVWNENDNDWCGGDLSKYIIFWSLEGRAISLSASRVVGRNCSQPLERREERGEDFCVFLLHLCFCLSLSLSLSLSLPHVLWFAIVASHWRGERREEKTSVSSSSISAFVSLSLSAKREHPLKDVRLLQP